MRTIYFLLITGLCFSGGNIFAQETLPDFTVKNNKGKISVSWQNKYTKEVKGISIQRSFDSSKYFSSITTLANPKELANGFIDKNASYQKMFYRLFIVFDSGAYIFTVSKRPEPDSAFNFNIALQKIREANKIKTAELKDSGKIINNPISSKKIKPVPGQQNVKTANPPVQQIKEEQAEPIPKKEEIPYPSQRIYTGKDNNIVVNLPDFKPGKIVINFYDEENKFLFVLNKVTEGEFIIEKVNFFHRGWFFFEIYYEEILVEKNKFYIPKD
jgi:hypothetical protein